MSLSGGQQVGRELAADDGRRKEAAGSGGWGGGDLKGDREAVARFWISFCKIYRPRANNVNFRCLYGEPRAKNPYTYTHI